MIDATGGVPETGVQPARADHTWRTAALILFSLTLVLISLVMVFSVVGLANAGPGGCGGG